MWQLGVPSPCFLRSSGASTGPPPNVPQQSGALTPPPGYYQWPQTSPPTHQNLAGGLACTDRAGMVGGTLVCSCTQSLKGLEGLGSLKTKPKKTKTCSGWDASLAHVCMCPLHTLHMHCQTQDCRWYLLNLNTHLGCLLGCPLSQPDQRMGRMMMTLIPLPVTRLQST